MSSSAQAGMIGWPGGENSGGDDVVAALPGTTFSMGELGPISFLVARVTIRI